MPDALIKKIHIAVKNGDIPEPFTAHDVTVWINKYAIIKEDDKPYKVKTSTLLSGSTIKSKKTKNRNSKWLYRRKDEDGIYEYWFYV
ncbi:MAG: hypothetical protein KAS23_08255 [Anaerohalosphaera sp.]|nr:hypothetical protein [Anaerohalosphaera sp.]